MKLLKKTVIAACLMLSTAYAMAQSEKVVEISLVDEQGGAQPVGTVMLADSEFGLVLTPDLKGLPPGLHGFHVHVNPDCGPKEQNGKMVAALAAGGHYDPTNTGKHGTPWGDGHLGDLPALYVAADGTATYPVLAPRLKVADVLNHSIMIHAGGENHSD